MSRRDYESRLQSMYKEFYNAGGICRYASECRRDLAQSECKFCSDKAAVGEYYGEQGLPKIAFVGLEALNKEGIVDDIDYPSTKAYNPHYKGVRYVLAYLISGLTGKPKPIDALKSTLSQYNEYMERYSLLNCYKCAFADRAQNLPHTDAMKKYCPQILFREMDILDPDILVIQIVGNRPVDFKSRLEKRYGKCTLLSGDSKTGAYRYQKLSGGNLFLVFTYHGSSDPNPMKRCWTNDNRSGNVYINTILNPVLDAVIDAYREQ